MAIFPSTAIPSGAEAFTIDQSLRFNQPDDATLSKTFASAGNRKTWTLSAWVKIGNANAESGNQIGIFGTYTSGSDTANIQIDGTSGELHFENYIGSYAGGLQVTEAKLRDMSSWYHILVAYDTTQSTEANRIKLYVNGTQMTTKTGGSNAYPSLNYDGKINNTAEHKIGMVNGTYCWDGYLAEVHFIDGTALTPTSFGETGDYGEWKPIEVSGLTYGTNGFYLDFADSAALGDDESGNTNDWTVNNLTASDQMVDSPTNNFATLNPLDNAASFTLSEGNLKSAVTGVNDLSPATFGMTSGKWYFEYYLVSGSDDVFGVSQQGKTNWHSDTGTWVLRSGSGTGALSWNRDTSTGYDMNYVNDFTNADVVSVAVDMDSGKIWFAINGTWNPDASNNTPNPASGTYPRYSNLSGTIVPVVSQSIGSGASTWVANFGQDSSFAGNKTAQGNQDGNDIGDFYYTPPSGYLALCTSNLPAVAVVPSEHFNTVLYTGNATAGAAAQTVTGVGFQSDFTWLKAREDGTAGHILTDAVRGTGESLHPNNTAAENSDSTAGHLSSWNSDGFVLYGGSRVNDADGHVAWNWKANGSGSSNTDGTINTTATSANVDAGFSISTYTGTGDNATIGHGLSVAPEMVIVKCRSHSGDWAVYRTDLGAANNMRLHSDAAVYSASTMWNSTASTADVFSIGTNGDVNTNTRTYLAYAFHSVDGYSKVGEYTGNGNADGTFVYTGFRPAWVMVKHTTQSESWTIWDTDRDTYNQADLRLFPNASTAETENALAVDILSNGFKFRHADASFNDSGDTFIYLAFAETPFKYSNAR